MDSDPRCFVRLMLEAMHHSIRHTIDHPTSLQAASDDIYRCYGFIWTKLDPESGADDLRSLATYLRLLLDQDVAALKDESGSSSHKLTLFPRMLESVETLLNRLPQCRPVEGG